MQVTFWTHPTWDMALALPSDDGQAPAEKFLEKCADPSQLGVQEVRDMTEAEFEAMGEFEG